MLHPDSSFFSSVARARVGTRMRDLAYRSVPGVAPRAQLANGHPASAAFPIATIDLNLQTGETVHIPSTETAIAQQYMLQCDGNGYAPLLAWCKTFMQTHHAPQYEDWHVVVTAGNAPACRDVWDLLLEEGDSILVEEHQFVNSMGCLEPHRAARRVWTEPIPIDAEHGGIDVGALETTLKAWQWTRPTKRFPKVLFLVPHAHNPCGYDTPEASMRRIYELCKEYNLVIVEDAPYDLLRFPSSPEATPPGFANLPPSCLQWDTDGRVVRLDSFSKWIGPGYRLGWVTASRAVLQRMTTTGVPGMGVSSFTQVVVAAMLQQWGTHGTEAHLRRVQSLYHARCQSMCDALDHHFNTRREISFRRPAGGMFVWVELLTLDADEAFARLQKVGIKVVPGDMFETPGPHKNKRSFLRLTFCNEDEATIEAAIADMATALRS